MKKSKTKSPFTRYKLNLVLMALAAFTFLSWRIYFLPETTREGPIKIRHTLLQEPKVYDKWQYFDIDGYDVKASSSFKLSYGDRLEVAGVLKSGKIDNPKIEIVGVSRWQKTLFSARSGLKAKIFAALPEPQASLLAGIVLGAKENLPENFGQDLRKTGTIHVVVVSGYNISVVAGFLIGLSRFIKRGRATILGIVGIVFYTLLVGAEPPAVRAAIMGGLAFTATTLGRQRFSLYALTLSAYLMLVVKPTIIADVGFQLSFLATAGIILFQEAIFAFFKFLPRPFSDDLATTLAAQSLVVPVIFYHFGSVSAISPVANAAILWLIPLATIFGFIFLAASLTIPLVAILISWLLWALLSSFVFLVAAFAKLSFAYLTFAPGNLWPLIIYYIVLASLVLYLKNARMARAQ